MAEPAPQRTPVSTTVRVPGGPLAPRAARRAVLTHLHGRLDQAQRADLEQVLSELVSNSVRHAHAGPDTEIEIEISIGERVRVAVVDSGSGFAPPAVAPDLSSPGGLGLFLVEKLSHAWGVTRTSGRTSVWSEFTL